MTNTETAAPPRSGGDSQGFVMDWVVPVVLGLALGAGIFYVGVPFVRRHLHSEAWTLVMDWNADPAGDDATLLTSLKALGPSARADLVTTLKDLPPDSMEAKIWLARQLTGEPWFDTTSLKEVLRDPNADKADRRAAACALLDTQAKEVDTELILPVIDEWLHDATSYFRALAIHRAESMWRASMLNSTWEPKIRSALLELAKPRKSATPELDEVMLDERAFAVLALSIGLPDDETKKLLWTVAKSEDDDQAVRVNAVRALSEGGLHDETELPGWVTLGKSADGVVRQTVADNLYRTPLASYDQVIEPLQFDAMPLARTGALDTQLKRRRPTMLPRFDELMEDSYEWVRFGAMFAAGVMKNADTEGQGRRAAIMLRLVESGVDPVDVSGAVLALRMITDETHGFQPTDLHLREQSVDEAALKAFMADPAGRKEAAAKWRLKFGATAVYTDADRAATLTKLLTHADPKNVERAKSELAKLGK